MSKEGKMADNSKSIAKQFQKIKEIDKKTALSRKRLSAECLHRKNGQYALVRKDGRDGAPTEWHCRICGAKIELRQIDQKKLQDAVDTVYQACNMIKLTARPDVSEKDASLIKMVSDIMFRIDAYLPSMYQAALSAKSNNKGERKGSRGGNVVFEHYGTM